MVGEAAETGRAEDGGGEGAGVGVSVQAVRGEGGVRVRFGSQRGVGQGEDLESLEKGWERDFKGRCWLLIVVAVGDGVRVDVSIGGEQILREKCESLKEYIC